jgi:hypothetical protein
MRRVDYVSRIKKTLILFSSYSAQVCEESESGGWQAHYHHRPALP